MSGKHKNRQQGKQEAGRPGGAGAKQSGPEAHTAVALTVTVLEDLHAGSGLGSASVDALLARDRQGRPVIRWSHLKGLLAESARERDRALGVTADLTEATLAKWFGHPDPAGQQRGSVRGLSLRLPSAGGAIEDSLVVSSTARQRLSRVPKEDTLRQVEYLRRGTVFSGELRVALAPDSKSLNDLLARLRRVSRLGAHRSRGDGLVHLTIQARPLQRPLPVDCEAIDANGSWATRRLLLRSLEPMCLAATGQPGNLIPTHTHLGSGTVAGMFIGWLLANGWTSLADAALQGRVVFGVACPLPPGIARVDRVELIDAVPIPLSMRRPKPPGQASRWPWWAAAEQDAAAPGETEKLKRPDANEYLWTADGCVWQRWRCPTQVTLRSDAGRSRLANSRQQLFSVEEVPEETDFVVTVQVRDDARAAFDAACQGLAAGKHWLQAGRGGAALQLLGHAEPAQADMAAAAGAGGQANQVWVFVETDLMLRTPGLEFRVSLDLAAARDLLREAGAAQDLLDALMTAESEVSEPTAVHGWNAATGAARLPAQAIRRGSVACLQFADATSADKARALLKASALGGLGERADEGHGRLRIDFSPPASEWRPTAELPPPNPQEEQMQAVQEWLNRAHMPAFTASRWQALREATVRGTTDVQDWFTRAEDEARRLQKGEAWITALRVERQTQREFLGRLALRAAKRAKRQRTGQRRDAAREDVG